MQQTVHENEEKSGYIWSVLEKKTLLKIQITDYPEEGLKGTAIKKSCILDLFKMYTQLTCLYVLMVSGSV